MIDIWDDDRPEAARASTPALPPLLSAQGPEFNAVVMRLVEQFKRQNQCQADPEVIFDPRRPEEVVIRGYKARVPSLQISSPTPSTPSESASSHKLSFTPTVAFNQAPSRVLPSSSSQPHYFPASNKLFMEQQATTMTNGQKQGRLEQPLPQPQRLVNESMFSDRLISQRSAAPLQISMRKNPLFSNHQLANQLPSAQNSRPSFSIQPAQQLFIQRMQQQNYQSPIMERTPVQQHRLTPQEQRLTSTLRIQEQQKLSFRAVEQTPREQRLVTLPAEDPEQQSISSAAQPSIYQIPITKAAKRPLFVRPAGLIDTQQRVEKQAVQELRSGSKRQDRKRIFEEKLLSQDDVSAEDQCSETMCCF